MIDGTRIKHFRRKRQISRKSLADKTDINIKTIRKWENGKATPKNLYKINLIANAIGCSLQDLCTNTEQLVVKEKEVNIELKFNIDELLFIKQLYESIEIDQLLPNKYSKEITNNIVKKTNELLYV